MISKRSKSLNADEVNVLEAMQYCRETEQHFIPKPVQQLSQGNMCIITPQIVPFITSLLRKINMCINEEKLKVFGSKMAKPCILYDALQKKKSDLHSFFIHSNRSEMCFGVMFTPLVCHSNILE